MRSMIYKYQAMVGRGVVVVVLVVVLLEDDGVER